ncbi:L,D-transpeptidase family protein [Peptostreptococcus russellii]|uniref:cell wall-binding repeat-containing protein n=1 Tax=Peptostreptococcus russellii TaxID=215200 RepID=UPI0016240A8D|nr:cell wall-binding repeat-containing protein [Peptostreptococcus russellii]MBC2577294.1 L,D-transpeptidase family protein [Peptostreptococcus russellii]
MNKFIKKSIVAISLAALLAPTLSISSYADESIVKDISGNDRFSTAVSISKNGWDKGSENVMLVNSQAVADSLSVAPLASKLKAPVLLTDSNALKWESKEEIKRLNSKRVIIIGGYNSVSKNIEDRLKSEGYKVERISGNTRVETSINIAKRLKDFSSGKLEEAFVVNGIRGLADAAGAGAVAAKNNAPIIFADKNKSEEIKLNLKNLAIGNVYLIGGKSSLPNSFESVAGNVERISGSNRQETNLKLIDKFYKNYKAVYIADDGSRNPSKLIDSVLINAGIIASNNSGEDVAYIEAEKSNPEKTKVDNLEKENLDASISKKDDGEVKEKISSKEESINEENSKIDSTESEDLKDITIKSDEDKTISNQNTSTENIEDKRNDNIKTDTKRQESGESTLEEGPVMLVSEDRGLTYEQMKNLNNDRNTLTSMVQVSGGKNFRRYMENMSDFIVNRNNKKAEDAFNKMMSYEHITITYNVAGNKKTLDGNSILAMINCNSNNGFNIEFNKEMLNRFVSSIDLSSIVDNSSSAYAYKKNGNIVIDKSGFGAVINTNKEVNKLVDMLNSGKSYYDLIPSYTKKEAPKGAMNLGKKYVQIDLKTQHMWVWKDNKAVVSTPIVSGNPNKGMATPPGMFTIKSKMRNVVLRGPGYASPVKYWIPFNGSIGIHDAYWQPVYGGNRYLYAGSHGCINTPLNAVGVLYNNVSVGTPVIVQSNASIR